MACISFTGCDFLGSEEKDQATSSQQSKDSAQSESDKSDSDQSESDQSDSQESDSNQMADGHEIILENIPDWNGEPSIEINDGEPAFTDSESDTIKDQNQDDLSSLDDLGRCGNVTACVSEDTMPEGSRGSIGMIKPAGWHLVKYDFIDGKYLYNRCHLIGWQLTGEGAEERNLITGTRYLNVEGMLPYENQVADYVRDTGSTVAYRVEPVYSGDDLLARGVHIEAKSIEDNGSDLSINVYCYNVQPNIDIDYETGDSQLDKEAATTESGEDSSAGSGDASESTYILNTNTKRYHLEGCRSLSQMKNKNKRTFHGSKKKLKEMGYAPCGNCNP